MNKYFKVYKPFINAGLQEALSYKANWIFTILGNILGCFVSFFLWKAVFLSSNSEKFIDFSFEQMIIYIFLIFLTSNLISSGGTYNIGEEIKDGSISMRIIKPINYNATFLFQEIGNKLVNVTIILIPVVLGVEFYRYYIIGHFQFNIVHFLLYVFSCICAYLINFFFNICYGFTAFVFKNLWGSTLLKNCLVNFLSGAIIPLSFLPTVLRKILIILPFASLNYTPVMIYMNKYTEKEMLFYIGLQIFWCVFFLILSKLIFKVVIKHLSIQGG